MALVSSLRSTDVEIKMMYIAGMRKICTKNSACLSSLR